MRSMKRTSHGTRIAVAACFGALILASPIVGSTKQNTDRSDVETRITTLHSQLKITKDQEASWKDVAQAMRDNAKTMTEMRSEQTDTEKSASAPDMINAYAKTMDAHADAVRKFASTFQPLYDRMSDVQKKTADSVFRDKVHEAARKKS